MSEAMTMVEREWLFTTLNALDQKMTEQHQRVRSEMHAGFDAMRADFKAHEREDREIADRVVVIETQREEEEKLSMKRGTWAGLLAAAGFSGILEVFKLWLHR